MDVGAVTIRDMKCNFPSGANCVSILRIIKKREQSDERADKKYMTPIFINANDDEDLAHMRCYLCAYNFCCDNANNINYEIIN